jgi:hypothetical protein
MEALEESLEAVSLEPSSDNPRLLRSTRTSVNGFGELVEGKQTNFNVRLRVLKGEVRITILRSIPRGSWHPGANASHACSRAGMHAPCEMKEGIPSHSPTQGLPKLDIGPGHSDPYVIIRVGVEPELLTFK